MYDFNQCFIPGIATNSWQGSDGHESVYPWAWLERHNVFRQNLKYKVAVYGDCKPRYEHFAFEVSERSRWQYWMKDILANLIPRAIPILKSSSRRWCQTMHPLETGWKRLYVPYIWHRTLSMLIGSKLFLTIRLLLRSKLSDSVSSRESQLTQKQLRVLSSALLLWETLTMVFYQHGPLSRPNSKFISRWLLGFYGRSHLQGYRIH
jgi:hypothetical protein